jgi:hypothetical protein
MSSAIRVKGGRVRSGEALVTRRVRALIDYAHEGNVREASIASGMPYATLRDLYAGKTTRPSAATLERLGTAYNFYGGWFTREDVSDEIPVGGLVVLLSELIPHTQGARHREVVIPRATWPLPWVLGEGMEIIENMPPSPTRPLLGEATGEETNRIMADIVLQPLLIAERAGLIPRLGSTIESVIAPETRAIHVPLMRHVGRYWQAILAGYQDRSAI